MLVIFREMGLRSSKVLIFILLNPKIWRILKFCHFRALIMQQEKSQLDIRWGQRGKRFWLMSNIKAWNENISSFFDLPGLWLVTSMLETKCVGVNVEMLVTVLTVFVTNILYLFNISVRHQYPKIVTNIEILSRKLSPR